MTVGGRGVSLVQPIEEIKVNLDNGGSVLTPGSGTSFYTATYRGRIKRWALTGYPSGNIELDIIKRNGEIPVFTDTICGGNFPYLSGQFYNTDDQLNNWEKNIEPGDVFGLIIRSASTLTSSVLTLTINAS
jgi:hypothetical protein